MISLLCIVKIQPHTQLSDTTHFMAICSCMKPLLLSNWEIILFGLKPSDEMKMLFIALVIDRIVVGINNQKIHELPF